MKKQFDRNLSRYKNNNEIPKCNKQLKENK